VETIKFSSVQTISDSGSQKCLLTLSHTHIIILWRDWNKLKKANSMHCALAIKGVCKTYRKVTGRPSRGRHSQGAYTNIRCYSAGVGLYTGFAVRLKYIRDAVLLKYIRAMLFCMSIQLCAMLFCWNIYEDWRPLGLATPGSGDSKPTGMVRCSIKTRIMSHFAENEILIS